MADRRAIGQRIATRRRARRLTQTDLARGAHVSHATIRAIERGARSPSDDTLDSIAAALGVDPSRLLADFPLTSERVRAALPEISAAIAPYDLPDGPPGRSLPELAEAVGSAAEWRLSAQYSRIASRAPALLTDILRAVNSGTSAGCEAARLLASAARSADAVAYKAGAHDLSARLVELMKWAAAQTGDPLLEAAAAYVRTEIFFASRRYAPGLHALNVAVDAAPSPTGTFEAAALGALHMRAAVIAGRAGDSDEAATHLTEARQLADGVREGIYGGTAFGPDSVRIHEVSVAVSLGNDHISRALDVAHDWKPPKNMPSERRSGFYVELARAQLWAGRRRDAFESLTLARAAAPQHTRSHPWAQQDVARLRRLTRAPWPELTAFAKWIGVV
ncbi:helix-turn-helix domain-containing protein [Streptomyces sp. NPDC004749]